MDNDITKAIIKNDIVMIQPETKRKLASIQKIIDLRPIEGADKIETAQVLGWECVVKKGEFKVGDLVVYFEVDSILPERNEFEFLRERKFRIKTIKLKKQVSQGLVMPLSILSSVGEIKEKDGKKILVLKEGIVT